MTSDQTIEPVEPIESAEPVVESATIEPIVQVQIRKSMAARRRENLKKISKIRDLKAQLVKAKKQCEKYRKNLYRLRESMKESKLQQSIMWHQSMKLRQAQMNKATC